MKLRFFILKTGRLWEITMYEFDEMIRMRNLLGDELEELEVEHEEVLDCATDLLVKIQDKQALIEALEEDITEYTITHNTTI